MNAIMKAENVLLQKIAMAMNEIIGVSRSSR
jgi:hypothetical protein